MIGAPSGIHSAHGDGLHGTLRFKADASHSDQQIVIGWSGLTLSAPIASGVCLNSSEWDATTGRLKLQLDPGAGCEITIHGP